MLNYPKSRLDIALDTAKAVRMILDLLVDQGDLAEALVNLAVLDAYDVIQSDEGVGDLSPKISGKDKTPGSDPQFGFDTHEVADLQESEDEEEDTPCRETRQARAARQESSISFKIVKN
jgi:hypothetical protein